MALKLIRGIINVPQNFPGCVATIGNFDGIHLGHRHLLERVTQMAHANDRARHQRLISFLLPGCTVGRNGRSCGELAR